MSITLPFRAPATDKRPGDYVPPKPDTSRVKLRITRTCWVTDGAEPSSVPAGTTLTLPRWQAQQIVDAGRGELS